jgi:drug/metabolite transporter (DMT)-like permease
MKALRIIPAFTVNLTYNLEPIYGVVLAFLIYREDRELNHGFYLGFALIIASVILQTMRVRKSAGGGQFS